MMFRTLIPLICLAAFAPQAHADKFYLGSEETAAKMTEGEPDVVEGVLLKEEDGFYVIRVEGGEIRLPKARVWKVEKTELTAAQVENREAEAESRLAQENDARRARLRADAEAEQSRIATAREAAAARQAAVVEAAVPVVPAAVGGYDPVLDVYTGSTVQYIVDDVIRTELGGLIRRAVQDDIRLVRRQLQQAIR